MNEIEKIQSEIKSMKLESQLLKMENKKLQSLIDTLDAMKEIENLKNELKKYK